MLGILAFVIIIVATYQAYKTAKTYERNAVMWALIVFGVGFGIQIIIPIIVGIIIGVVLILNGTPPEQLENAVGSYAIILNIFFIIFSVAAMLLILKYIGKVPDEDFTAPSQPPPPPEFNGN